VPAHYLPTQSTGSSATYVPSSASYTLDVTAATGACWVEVQEQTNSGATPVTTFGRTLNAGESQSFTLTGIATIQLGAPAQVTMTLDGAPLVLPTGFLTPFTLTLQPSAAADGTTGAGGTGTGAGSTTTTSVTAPAGTG
jgi:hypothetical protein